MNTTELVERSHRILIIDDNPMIHEDIRKILCPAAAPGHLAEDEAVIFGEAPPAATELSHFEIDSALQGQEGLALVERALAEKRPYSMAFVDVRMPPGWDGVETIQHIWNCHADIQVVICTAYSDHSWGEIIRKLGKSDSLLILKKPFDNVEVLQLAHALTKKWVVTCQARFRLDNLESLVEARTQELMRTNEKLKKEITERMLLENALRLSEERFSKAFKASPIPLAIQSLQQEKYVDANQGFQQLTGYSHDELIGRTPQDLSIWGDPAEGTAMLQTLREQMSVRNMPCRLRSKSKQLRQVLLSVELFELGGEPFLLTIAQDITEQLTLENQLRQAQKMEAVGQLAAGVAHDFNNILTVIQGHISLVLDDQTPDSKDRAPLQTVLTAADRASKLVRQLLAFSRKQIIQMRPMAIRETFLGLAEMLPRVLRENVQVQIHTPASDLQINADAGMMDQMLMNLAVNARDAMPEGGLLSISAEMVELSPALARHNQEARPGRFVRVSMTDTGCGIAPEILPRIFEPFFTTKPVGQGTGLGLAAVYGIAKQHGGWVEVLSQPGQGTTFHVFIPTCAVAPEAGLPPLTQQRPKGGHETILVAEDNEDLRDFVVCVLESHGYKVISASSGQEALAHWAKGNETIQLLLTDIVMPGGLSGRQLAENLLAKNPALRVLYTSGYTPGMAGQDLALLEGHAFLAKPYEPATLVQRVRECLDGRLRSPAKCPTTLGTPASVQNESFGP